MSDAAGEGDGSGSGTAAVLVSGGMDSATVAYEARERGYDLHFLHASYGQETEAAELERARELADRMDVAAFVHLDAGHLAAIGGSTLTDPDRPVQDADRPGDVGDAGTGDDRTGDGTGDDRTADGDRGTADGGTGEGDDGTGGGDAGSDDEEVPASYVPFRNANLLSMAVSYAEAEGCAAAFVGAHDRGGSGYPDCRPAFFEAFQRVVDLGTDPDTDLDVVAPFSPGSKADVVRRGAELGVPFEATWSCYRSAGPACGTCEACVNRLRAFAAAGVTDPIEYERRPTFDPGPED